ncbi:MAG: valine--pyruvate transaminase [Desulfocapsaceae bacterium]|nr:valine--pyruvate transaminase [Desulfocapsaceae bacterium]
MEFSEFGKKFTDKAGILSLMEDMARAMGGSRDMIMMGGGNPGYIETVQEIVRKRLLRICADRQAFHRLVGVYNSPQGEPGFIRDLAALLRREYNWPLGPENICLTNGSQTSFFLLFNMFAGEYAGKERKRIRLPLTPEYIGYADIGLNRDFFIATRPRIDYLEDHLFKYRIDFDGIRLGEETGAICVSRPTNPTGNVVTDEEVGRLDRLAGEHGVPLIIDSAYGQPFPGIVYSEVMPIWNENIVLCLSLSKLGLPAVRTGIIVARQEIVAAVSGMNAIMSLAPGSFGAVLAGELVGSGDILSVSKTLIRPFYRDKVEKALAIIDREFKGLAYRVHRPEGAMFLWLWFQGLPISSLELYERLKVRGVLVISGHYFFPGLEDDPWMHKNECLRLTYSQDEAQVAAGIVIIAQEVRRAFAEAGMRV